MSLTTVADLAMQVGPFESIGPIVIPESTIVVAFVMITMVVTVMIRTFRSS